MTHTPPPFPTDPGKVELHARAVDFDLSETPLHWIPGHPVASNVISALNLLLPEGERFFVQTFSEALPLVTDEELAADMRGFIGQEAVHAQTHDKAVDEWLVRHGVDPAPYRRQMEWIFRKVLGPRPNATPEERRKHLVERLWMIAAAEHFTALLGDYALNNRWSAEGADPNMADLFAWHGAEEVEHRTVAYDVATYFADTRSHRRRSMVIAIPLGILLARGVRFLNRADPDMSLSAVGRFREYFRGTRADVVPPLRILPKAVAAYFRSDYSPADVGDTAQAVAYLAASPAARRAV
ncbi:MAG: metal-dependent hydrolase [Gordonia sp. (in: high G+C Gram-positive bacteria)]